MEASDDFLPVQATRPRAGILTGIPRLTPAPHGPEDADRALDAALAVLRSSNGTASTDSTLYGVTEASDFAGRVEELSRMVDYLQLVAAAAVDRTRSDAAAGAKTAAAKFGSNAPAGWLTGWNVESSAPAGLPSDCTGKEPGAAELSPGWVDDGYRNTAEFLRARLRISAAEARRRLALAAEILPSTGMAGQPLPAAKEKLAAAVASGDVASRAATIISISLDRVRHACPPGAAARMEQALTLTAVENDQDFLTRIARRWTDALDQDGEEPSEQELRQRQGAFIRQARRGLHHVEIFATTDQFEHLVTVMSIATNPRTGAATPPDAGTEGTGNTGSDAAVDGIADAADGDAEDTAAAARLDQRTRPQRLLDGLVGACKAALAAGTSPPQEGCARR
ncbi:DUF222 domain-containing protein [Arthrobacter sp. PsM3]|nr:DUF222 domain-containing protein [Arthrobacter sp. PsM3]MDN4644774.1 DUF222 domain-containing protein [Arthrobacter sp. PsM3]